jgi:hypothetical protein
MRESQRGAYLAADALMWEAKEITSALDAFATRAGRRRLAG